MGGTGRILSLSSTLVLHSPLFHHSSKRFRLLSLSVPSSRSLFQGFRPLCSLATPAAAVESDTTPVADKHSLLLEKLRIRHIKARSAVKSTPKQPKPLKPSNPTKTDDEAQKLETSFEELGLNEELLAALKEMGISVPTEIQRIGIRAVIEGKSVVLGSHTGSGKTLAYLLPIIQLMRLVEAETGIQRKAGRPRAIVLCPTRELSEQVFRVAKSISHHARFRCTMVSGGSKIRLQEDSLHIPVDMIVGTPGRIIQHIEEGNIFYGDIRYLVLDEADTMFDHGFGPEIRKFLEPLKKRTAKPDRPGFQTVLVAATMTKAVQTLVGEEFEGISHVRTSSLHKKVSSARHDFLKLSGHENKLEVLLQVLKPSLAKGNKVMVFCNTLNSSRAVDHYLVENNIYTVNYHGEVPAQQRVENLRKFKTEDGDSPTLVCTDLAARGLDLDVDHVIMFDFPTNSVDYLHRTGRTARMGAKGKVTSILAKKDLGLANQIEEAMKKNESIESLSKDKIWRDSLRSVITQQTKWKTRAVTSAGKRPVRSTDTKPPVKNSRTSSRSSKGKPPRKTALASRSAGTSKSKPYGKASSSSGSEATAITKAGKSTSETKKPVIQKKLVKVPSISISSSDSKEMEKINLPGFRGRSSQMRSG